MYYFVVVDLLDLEFVVVVVALEGEVTYLAKAKQVTKMSSAGIY